MDEDLEATIERLMTPAMDPHSLEEEEILGTDTIIDMTAALKTATTIETTIVSFNLGKIAWTDKTASSPTNPANSTKIALEIVTMTMTSTTDALTANNKDLSLPSKETSEINATPLKELCPLEMNALTEIKVRDAKTKATIALLSATKILTFETANVHPPQWTTASTMDTTSINLIMDIRG